MPRKPRLPSWLRRRRLTYLQAMERDLGPLIWPSDHTHAIRPWRMTEAGVLTGGPVRDCPACIKLHTHSPGCECGHCGAQWWGSLTTSQTEGSHHVS
jgi:hypothetical protein